MRSRIAFAALAVAAGSVLVAAQAPPPDAPPAPLAASAANSRQQASALSTELQALAQSNDDSAVPVLIVLREQPAGELMRAARDRHRAEADAIEHDAQSLRAAAAGSSGQALEEPLRAAAQRLDDLELRVRREAIEEMRRQIGPEQNRLAARLESIGATGLRRYSARNMIRATLPASALRALGTDPAVASVFKVSRDRRHLDVSTGSLGANIFWWYGYYGSGQSVAVLDTGLNAGHPAFGGLNVQSQVFLSTAWSNDVWFQDTFTPQDNHGHGTHVSGIVASRGSYGGWEDYRGVAPALSTLYNLKVGYLDAYGGGGAYDDDVADAIDWALAYTPVRIFNYSYGGTPYSDDSDWNRTIDDYVDDYGLTFVVSAGNEGPGSYSVSSPGDAHNVISVANYDDRNTFSRFDDGIASSSSRGPTWGGRHKPDLAAPGTDIVSAAHNSSSYVSKTGTSMAAPHIAGAAALLRGAGVTSGLALKALLLNSASGWGWYADSGWGYADLAKAFALRSSVISSSISAGTARFFKASAPTDGGKATLAWNRHVIPTYYYGTSSCLNNLNLDFYDRYANTALWYSWSTIDNVEQVRTTRATTLVAKVKALSSSFCGVTVEPFAIAFSNAVFTETTGPSLSLACSLPGTVDQYTTTAVTCTVTNNGGLEAFDVLGSLSASAFGGTGGNAYGTLAPGASATRTWLLTAPGAGASTNVSVSVSSASYGETFLAARAQGIQVVIPPTAATAAASSVGSTTATVNGLVNPQGVSTAAYFEYGLTSAYGSMTASEAVGAGYGSVATSASVTGLACGATYHARLVAAHGTTPVYANDITFTTNTCAPTATTQRAVGVSAVGGTLTALVSSGGVSGTVYFEYGTTTGYGSTTTAEALAAADINVMKRVTLSGLTPGARYHFRVVVSTALGTTLGQDAAFLATAPQLDFDGDQLTDVAFWRPSTGAWWVLQSNGNFATSFSRTWGTSAAGDVPVAADYDGDGQVDPAFWRPSAGTWWVLLSGRGYAEALTKQWGAQAAGDIPVPGDYDGDGKADFAFWRPSAGTWWILYSRENYTTYLAKPWGVQAAGDKPVPADYDGDGKTDLAFWRPSAGAWWVLLSGNNYTTYLTRTWGTQAAGDIPTPGDYDGDGKADFAFWRPSAGTWWALLSGSTFTTSLSTSWGTQAAGDVPVPGDYDGDGKMDPAFWRPSSGTWWLLLSASNYTSYVARQWGVQAAGDTPVNQRR